MCLHQVMKENVTKSVKAITLQCPWEQSFRIHRSELMVVAETLTAVKNKK